MKYFLILLILANIYDTQNKKIDCLFRAYLNEKYTELKLSKNYNNLYKLLDNHLNNTIKKNVFKNKNIKNRILKNLKLNYSIKINDFENNLVKIPKEFQSFYDELNNICYKSVKKLITIKYYKYYFCKTIVNSTPTNWINEIIFMKNYISDIFKKVFEEKLKLFKFREYNQYYETEDELKFKLNNFLNEIQNSIKNSTEYYNLLLKKLNLDNIKFIKILQNQLNINKIQAIYTYNYFKKLINLGNLNKILKFMNIIFIKFNKIKFEKIISNEYVFINKLTKLLINYDKFDIKSLNNKEEIKLYCIHYLKLSKDKNIYICQKNLIILVDKNFLYKMKSDLLYKLIKSDSFKTDLKNDLNFILKEKFSFNVKENKINLQEDLKYFLEKIDQKIRQLMIKLINTVDIKFYPLFYEILKLIESNKKNHEYKLKIIKNILMNETSNYGGKVNNLYEFSNEITNLKNKILYKINKKLHKLNYEDYKINLILQKLLKKCYSNYNANEVNLCINLMKNLDLNTIKNYYSYQFLVNYIYLFFIKIKKKFNNNMNLIKKKIDENLFLLLKENTSFNGINNEKFSKLLNFIINTKLQYNNNYRKIIYFEINKILYNKENLINTKNINSYETRNIIKEVYYKLKNFNSSSTSYDLNYLNLYKNKLEKNNFVNIKFIKNLLDEFRNNLNFIFLHYENLSTVFQKRIDYCRINLSNKFKKCQDMFGEKNCEKLDYIVRQKCPFNSDLENKVLCLSKCPNNFMNDELFCKKPQIYELNFKDIMKNKFDCKRNFKNIGIFCIPQCPNGHEDLGSHCKRILIDKIKYFVWEENDN